MTKTFYLGLLFLPALIPLVPLSAPAQTFSGGVLPADVNLQPSPTPAAEPEKKKGGAAAPQGPTTIDSQSMDYDGKTRVAVFTGDNYGVLVKDPSFTVYCDKLTAYMRKPAPKGAPGAQASPAPSPAAKGAAGSRASGLQRAIAEGPTQRPVVIVQDHPATATEAAQRDVGIAAKADYNADTGDIVLTGWPRVSQGINTQIATSEGTIMIMNKDGRTMKTSGPSRTVIQEQDQPKKSGTNSSDAAADQSSSPSPQ